MASLLRNQGFEIYKGHHLSEFIGGALCKQVRVTVPQNFANTLILPMQWAFIVIKYITNI